MAHVLIPTDFSSNSLNAAKYAVNLYGTEGNVFTILNCYMMPRGTASTMWSIDDMLAKESVEGATEFAERLKEELADLSPVIEVISEHGDLPNVINRFQDDEVPPEIVVMGTQGATGLKEVLLGSNTADVIKRSSIPVLAVPQDATYHIPKRIIVADDAGPVSEDTIRVLRKIAVDSKAELVIVRVLMAKDSKPEEPGASAYDTLLAEIPHTNQYIPGDNVITALSELVGKSDVDMVVLLHRHRGLFEQLFHRSTATKLAMHTHVPMLVLQRTGD